MNLSPRKRWIVGVRRGGPVQVPRTDRETGRQVMRGLRAAPARGLRAGEKVRSPLSFCPP